MKKTILLMVGATAMLMACSKDDDTTTTTTTTGTSSGNITIGTANTTSSSALGNTGNGKDTSDLLANNSFANTVTIAFSGTSASISNSVSGVSITQSNGVVTVNSTATGVNYKVSGTTSSGQLAITSSNAFKLTLNGANITNASGAAIQVASNVKGFVELVAGTTNTLSSSAAAAFLSSGALLFEGAGTLNLASTAKHGIAANYVRVTEGNITVTAAASHAIQGTSAVYVDGGTLNLTCTKDGIQCEEGKIFINDGSITINAGDDGITAAYESTTSGVANLTINGGTINVTAVGEGLEAKNILTINGGTINLNTTDDAINAGEALYFNGGKTYAYATGNDAIDTNGKLGITGGVVVAIGTAAAPETSVDATAEDSSWSTGFTITGGYLVAIGVGNTPDTPLTNSTQKTVMLGSLSGSASQIVNITSTSGTEVVTFKAPVAYSHLMVSNSKLANGTYNLYMGGSVSGGENFNGLYTSGTYSGGTSSSQFTVSSQVTTSGASSGFGGGAPGRRPGF